MNREFLEAFDRTMGNEGGFQRSASDRGNWTGGKVGVGILKGTKYGISAATYPDLDIEGLTYEDARRIYWRDWWLTLEMERFPYALSYQMFDAAIHHGMGNATKMLQRALGVKDDGWIGPITYEAIRRANLFDLLMLFLAERLEFFTELRGFKTYGRGWCRRVAQNIRYAAEDTP